jgi:O-6-methylguanine DNA methyltransferase
MDAPMTTTDGPTANHPAAGQPAQPPAVFPATEEPAWAVRPGDRPRTGGAGGVPGGVRQIALLDPPLDHLGAGGSRRRTAADPVRVVEQESPPAVGKGNRATIPVNGVNPRNSETSQTVSMFPTPSNAKTGASTTIESPAIDILAAAARPDTDPCDVACDAMPAHLVGDLTPPEDAWLLAHTDICSYCRNVLHRYERVDEMLDRLQRYLDPLPAPPPFRPPVSARTDHPRRLAHGADASAAHRRASYGTLESPVGPLRVAVSDAGVCEIGFAENETEAEFRYRLEERGFAPEPCLEWDLGPAGVARVTRQLEEYFTGRRDRFDLPLDFAGVSPFTRSVLNATTAVPFGHLATYRDIAQQIGAPRATRAVGNALGRNPIPVIVPCHRIVRSDATLGGYTGGLGIKKRLLAIEGVAPLR